MRIVREDASVNRIDVKVLVEHEEKMIESLKKLANMKNLNVIKRKDGPKKKECRIS